MTANRTTPPGIRRPKHRAAPHALHELHQLRLATVTPAPVFGKRPNRVWTWFASCVRSFGARLMNFGR